MRCCSGVLASAALVEPFSWMLFTHLATVEWPRSYSAYSSLSLFPLS